MVALQTLTWVCTDASSIQQRRLMSSLTQMGPPRQEMLHCALLHCLALCLLPAHTCMLHELLHAGLFFCNNCEAPLHLQPSKFTVAVLPFPQTLYQQPTLACHKTLPAQAGFSRSSLTSFDCGKSQCLPAFLSVQATMKCMLPNIWCDRF